MRQKIPVNKPTRLKGKVKPVKNEANNPTRMVVSPSNLRHPLRLSTRMPCWSGEAERSLCISIFIKFRFIALRKRSRSLSLHFSYTKRT
ncbi:hypothetical protein AVEN_147573-1, partial [Araneus ventricosus]